MNEAAAPGKLEYEPVAHPETNKIMARSNILALKDKDLDMMLRQDD
jgi:hypothetical protein